MTPYEKVTWKERFHREAAKFKNMSLRDRLWYIWEYYKFPIIGIILVIGFTASIGSAIYGNRFGTALSCVILNGSYTKEPQADSYFNEGFRQFAGLNPNIKIEADYTMSLSFDDSAMNEFTYANLAKLTAILSSHDMDVMIGPPDVISHYMQMGGFLDMKEELPPGLYRQIKDDIYTTVITETGQKSACGIYIGDTSFEKKTGLTIQNPVLAIPGNSKRKDTAFQLIRYIFQP